MRSVAPTGPSKTRTLALVSSTTRFMSSPFRPMMLPTLSTGTTSLNALSPGHPGHLLRGGNVGLRGGWRRQQRGHPDLHCGGGYVVHCSEGGGGLGFGARGQRMQCQRRRNAQQEDLTKQD
jgi:hypothetical protein